MRSTLVFLLALAFCSFLHGQSIDYGNDWYDSGTSYIALKVVETGIYRVSAQDLQTAGHSTTGINPNNFHLLFRGQEQPVYVESSGGNFQFLEFVGRPNDGLEDTILFQNPFSQPTTRSGEEVLINPSKSLFSDTAVYYLYWDNLPGLRITNSADTTFSQYSPEPWIWARTHLDFHDHPNGIYSTGGGNQYDPFTRLNSAYTYGEGFMSEQINFGPSFSQFQISTPLAVTGGPPAQIYWRIFSGHHFEHIHHFAVNGTLLRIDTTDGMGLNDFNTTWSSPVSASTTLSFSSQSQQNAGFDLNYLGFADFIYPHQPNLSGASTFEGGLDNQNTLLLELSNSTGQNKGWVWDLGNMQRVEGQVTANTFQAILPAGAASRKLVLATDQGLKTPKIEGSPSFSNLSDNSQGAEFVLITNRQLSTSATSFANWKQNTYSTKVVYLDEIWSEFGYGSPTPLAIRRFCTYAIENWSVTPEYFLFWGRGTELWKDSTENLVPNYGVPASDQMFLQPLDLDAGGFEANAAIGRVPILTNDEGINYLNKAMQYTAQIPVDWMRNMVFLDGGRDSLEQNPVNRYSTEWQQMTATDPYWGRNHYYFRRDSLMDSTISVPAHTAIDSGVSLIHFFAFEPGVDIELEQATDYENWGKFPVILATSTGTAGNHNLQNDWGRNWLVEGGRGAIAWMGYSSYIFLTPTALQHGFLFSYLTDSLAGQPLGKVLQATQKKYNQDFPQQLHLDHALQFQFWGDPSLVLKTAPVDVWPGDANDDRTADVFDLLNIGLAYGESGTTRPNASLVWNAQPGPFWNQYLPDSLNYKFMDCDGSGVIDSDDTLAIFLNYGLFHNKTHDLQENEAGIPLSVTLSSDSLQSGDTLGIAVALGTSVQVADSVYGIAFSLYYDPQMVDTNTFEVNFDNCWMGTGNDLLTMTRNFPGEGRIDIGITRTNHIDTTGTGVLVKIGVVVIDNVSGKFNISRYTDVAFEPLNHEACQSNGNRLDLQVIKQTTVLQSQVFPEEGIAVYPNPASDEVNFELEPNCDHVLVSNLRGEILAEWKSPGQKLMLDVSEWTAGMYLLQVVKGGEKFQKKFLVVD